MFGDLRDGVDESIGLGTHDLDGKERGVLDQGLLAGVLDRIRGAGGDG
jgi:hypothetical protein